MTQKLTDTQMAIGEMLYLEIAEGVMQGDAAATAELRTLAHAEVDRLSGRGLVIMYETMRLAGKHDTTRPLEPTV